MAAKIKLTGKRVGKVIETNDYFRFDMKESGSPSVPKGLPKSSIVHFTVFVNKKQARKINLAELPKDTKVYLEGEITLDLPVDQCPGEVGVIAFQIQAIPSDEERERLRLETKEKQRQEAEELKKRALEEALLSMTPSELIARITELQGTAPELPESMTNAPEPPSDTQSEPIAQKSVEPEQATPVVEAPKHKPKVITVLSTESETDSAWADLLGNSLKELLSPIEEVATTTSEETVVQVEVGPEPTSKIGDILIVPITEVEVPEGFRQVTPNPEKSAPVLKLMATTGKQDKPIEVKLKADGTYLLLDGYRRYYLAEALEWTEVEIVITQVEV